MDRMGCASADQTWGYEDKNVKLMKSKTFPKCFNKKVDMKKVSLDVIRPWITSKVTELIGVEDDIVIDFAVAQLEEGQVDPKMFQINMTGFLERKAAVFCKELWELLLSAQENPAGVPQQFIDDKRNEMLVKKAEQQRLEAEIAKRKAEEDAERRQEMAAYRAAQKGQRDMGFGVEEHGRRQERVVVANVPRDMMKEEPKEKRNRWGDSGNGDRERKRSRSPRKFRE